MSMQQQDGARRVKGKNGGGKEAKLLGNPRTNPLGPRSGAVPQLNGIAQVVGLALGSPEFQRH
jgi:hypothetical protein